MKWLRRLALALACLVVVAAASAALMWWRLRQEPAELATAPAMNAAEAERVLRGLAEPSPLEVPFLSRHKVLGEGGWAPGSPIRPPRTPREDSSARRSADGARSRAGRPYRLTLGPREVTALVVSQIARVASQQIGDVRVAVRAHDLLAAGRLRATALAGSVLSIAAVPAAGRGGRLCLRLGEPSVGGQRIPPDLIEQLGGEGTHVPRTLCVVPRSIGLPGAVLAARIAGGGVVIDGVR